MKLIIHGARGSHPTPGRNYLEFGGNTSCVEIVGQNGENLFLDAGTGLGFAGLKLIGKKDIVADILLSHLHSDHIFSLPHFMPLYAAGNKIRIWVTKKYCDQYLLKTGVNVDLNFVMSYPYYPISPDKMLSKPELCVIESDKILIHGLEIDHRLMEHYEGSVAYKISSEDKTIIYASDVADAETLQYKTVEFCQGADLLIWDSLYTPEQINNITKYKHSAIDSVVMLAKKADVPRVLHFHHSPLSDDETLQRHESIAQELAGGHVKSEFAREGMIIEL